MLLDKALQGLEMKTFCATSAEGKKKVDPSLELPPLYVSATNCFVGQRSPLGGLFRTGGIRFEELVKQKKDSREI